MIGSLLRHVHREQELTLALVGRRRPYMVVGSLVVAICLFVLGWAKEIVQFSTGNPDIKTPTIILAVFTIYVLDFAINAVQFSCRSLIIDVLPMSQQQAGSAWAGRMAAFGHLIGYGLGALDLGEFFGDRLGDSQFKRMTVISAAALVVTIGTTSLAVNEAVLISDGHEEGQFNLLTVISDIFKTAMTMPERIRAICLVQFWAWIGWFPFMVYAAEWVGEIYLRYDTDAPRSADRLGEVGKIGSGALIVFSIVTSVGSVVLPWMIDVPDGDSRQFTARPPAVLGPVLEVVSKWKKPKLVQVWLLSHLVFAGAMFLTPFASSMIYATTLVSVCGLPWCLMSWACMTYMGIEINRMGRTDPNTKRPLTRRNSMTVEEKVRETKDAPGDEEGNSGVYLGILNVFTTAAQFCSTLMSWIIFGIFEPGTTGAGSSQGTSGIAISLVIGAVAALVACRLTWKLKLLVDS